MSACFWCDKHLYPRQRTRDHVVPRMMGGTDRHTNIVIACQGCNNARGQLTCLAAEVMKAKTGNPTSREVQRLIYRCHQIKPHLEKWVKIETERYGSSPSSKLDLDPPKTANFKDRKAAKAKGIPRADLAAARKLAESRWKVVSPQLPAGAASAWFGRRHPCD